MKGDRMARGRKPKEPRYYASRGAYYTKHKGKQYCLAVGPEGGATYVLACEVFGKVLRGELDDKRNTASNDMTVSQLRTVYLGWLEKNRKAGTLRVHRINLDTALVAFGGVRIRDLSPKMVEDFIAKQTAWQANTQRSFVNSLQSALNWGVKKAEILSNPLKGKVLAESPKSRGKDCLIYNDEHAMLLGRVPDYFGQVLSFLRATGCRPMELCRLAAKYWSGQRRCFTLPNDPRDKDSHKTAHSGKHRVIFVPPSILPMVEGLLQRHPTGYLFRAPNGSDLDSQKITSTFKYWKRRCCLRRKLSAYSYRHAYATNFLVGDGDKRPPGSPMILAELLGTSVKMLEQHYSHLEAFQKGLSGYADMFDAVRDKNEYRDRDD